jgi:pyruvate kinase
MTSKLMNLQPEAWDEHALDALIDELWSLRRAMLDRENRLAPWLNRIASAQRPSAVNLAHYLALRHIDLRSLQEKLAWVGVSSLGRAETHVLANVDKVLGILQRLADRPGAPQSSQEPAGLRDGDALLAQHAEALFGAAPAARKVRIMVTLPSEAASDEALIAALVDAGMDIARINCAHDSATEWVAMADSVRRCAKRAGRLVRVLIDLAGPKLRTGAIADAEAVVKLKPTRDALGRVTANARLGLRPAGSTEAVDGVGLVLGVDSQWLQKLAVGDRLDLIDTRSAKRRFTVVERRAGVAVVECDRTAYLDSQTELQLQRREHKVRSTLLADIPARPGELRLERGDILNLVAFGLGHGKVSATATLGARASRACIACTLPEALPQIRQGERIWFDDGRIGGLVRRASATRVEVEITDARDGGERLAADKGINLPDTRLDLAALTAKDLDDLGVVAQHADIVGMSFAQSADDVTALRKRLDELGAADRGLMLKVETRRGFEHLPEMLLAAMTGPSAGVMIARGDLAVECGYERMAEIQEEILWACEAAHMPVVWATQVLETQARTGMPSRAEITDAAMGGRAECVMLNKGPHILDAMRTLSDILRRMQQHQSKKRPLLRALKAWDLPLGVEATAPGDTPAKAKRAVPRPRLRSALKTSPPARRRPAAGAVTEID